MDEFKKQYAESKNLDPKEYSFHVSIKMEL